MKSTINPKVLAQFAKSKETEALVYARAKKVAAAAGPGFTATSRIGKNRARASVKAETFSARVRNSRENILIRALEAGRG